MDPKNPRLAALLIATASLAACAPAAMEAPPPASAAASPLATAEEDRALTEFLDRAFDERIALSPEQLTGLGIKQDYGRLDDYTGATDRRSLEMMRAQLAEMKSRFDFATLGPSSRLSYRLFEDMVARAERQFVWRSHRFPVSTNGSPAGQIPVFLINQHRVDTIADAEAYVSRLRDVERVMREVSDRLRQQAAEGVVPPRFNFEPIRNDALLMLKGAPFEGGPDNPLLADFRKKVDALDAPADVEARLLAQAGEALTGPFRRGVGTLLAALDQIEPRATGNDGAWSLPNGEAYYAHQLAQNTTTSLSADEIHRIGLAEVARIHGEMERIKERVGFAGTLQQFFTHLKTDSRFSYSNTDAGRQQYLAEAKTYIAQVMEAAPRWFRRLPKAPLEVRAVEPWRQATASVAFYNRPAPDGSRPGIFYVNLADMSQVLKPQTEVIAYHEGAPGHHFQSALAQELPNVPKFRRFGGYVAYSEGWGLYSERLGKEMGFYQDPYSEFGFLSLELWRAVRLVVDTGLHAKRWPREQAIRYFQENSLLSERNIRMEVDRYINNPGQATAYKIGQLKILELRDRARRKLGDRFDIRDFHAAVLENGAVPLGLLEEQVDAYVASRN